MSILADIFVATPEQALAYDGTEKNDNIERIELTDVTELELAILWSVVEEIEFDFDEHELEFIDNTDDISLYRFPDSLIFLLSRLTKDDIEKFAAIWADTEEMQWSPEQAQEALTSLVNLAQKALDQAKSIYLWSSL